MTATPPRQAASYIAAPSPVPLGMEPGRVDGAGPCVQALKRRGHAPRKQHPSSEENNMTNPQQPRLQLLTLPEVARRLSVCTKTLRRWIGGGQLRIHRLGRQLRVSEEDLQVFVASRRT